MNYHQQLILVFVVLFVALIYIIWLVKQNFKQTKDGCYGCHGCDIKKQMMQKGMKNSHKKAMNKCEYQKK